MSREESGISEKSEEAGLSKGIELNWKGRRSAKEVKKIIYSLPAIVGVLACCSVAFYCGFGGAIE